MKAKVLKPVLLALNACCIVFLILNRQNSLLSLDFNIQIPLSVICIYFSLILISNSLEFIGKTLRESLNILKNKHDFTEMAKHIYYCAKLNIKYGAPRVYEYIEGNINDGYLKDMIALSIDKSSKEDAAMLLLSKRNAAKNSNERILNCFNIANKYIIFASLFAVAVYIKALSNNISNIVPFIVTFGLVSVINSTINIKLKQYYGDREVYEDIVYNSCMEIIEKTNPMLIVYKIKAVVSCDIDIPEEKRTVSAIEIKNTKANKVSSIDNHKIVL